jgi:(E)-4-hydroxy-3-methylbut-2-enyl-diphosphate synthase
VARRIADRYNGRAPVSYVKDAGLHGELLHVDNFYHYARRPARELSVGPIKLGGEQPPRVLNRLPAGLSAKTLLSILEAQLKSSKNVPPEILEWPVRGAADLDSLRNFRRELDPETSRVAYLARLEGLSFLGKAFAVADAVLTPVTGGKGAATAAEAAKAAGKPLFLESADDDALLEAARDAATVHKDIVLSLTASDLSSALRRWRFVAAQPWIKDAGFPFLLRGPTLNEDEESLLQSATLAGALLCDGLGDAVAVGGGRDLAGDLRLAYNVLQGAGTRITKTEFVSCPSCGRTLFDLQTTTERIKKQTGHLVGVKIAIMGCIVNGPGEMADADFGYVGGGPDKINLYVGKECVEKGIPATEADHRLIALIRSHGKWTDPA